jgi:hypothetical protein
MNKEHEGFKSNWISIHSYDVFKVIFGILIIAIDLYLYIEKYYNFEGKNDLGKILAISLAIGIILLVGGMDSWKERDTKFKQLDDIKIKLEKEKAEAERENIRRRMEKD